MKWITEVIEERKNKEQKEFLKNLHLKLMSNTIVTPPLPESASKNVLDFIKEIGVPENDTCLFYDGAQYGYNLALKGAEADPLAIKSDISNVTNNIPRRIRIDLFTTAEKAIHDAMMEVEKAGADVRLTDAVNLLQQAQSKVADFVDNINP